MHSLSDPPLTDAQLALVNPRVRLTPREQLGLREAFENVLPAGASVYLYGSRTDRNARGGDIDLLVHLPGLQDERKIELAAAIATAIERRLGERKVDLLLTASIDASAAAFVAAVLPKAVRLFP